jgi:hypothetical protein
MREKGKKKEERARKRNKRNSFSKLGAAVAQAVSV